MEKQRGRPRAHDAAILERFRSGESVVQIAEAEGCSRPTVYAALARCGVKFIRKVEMAHAIAKQEANGSTTLSGTVGLPTHVTREPGVSGADDRQESA